MTRKRPAIGPILDAITGLRQRQRADGSWRIWWEPTAKQRAAGCVVIELDATKPGHASREARRANAEAALRLRGDAPQPRATGRSIADLINDYRQSLAFRTRAPATRNGYTSLMKAIEDKWGPQAVVSFDRPIVQRWYETLHAIKGPFMALALKRMLSILFTHAELRGWRPENSNPCLKLRTEPAPDRSRVATWAEINALLAAARRLKARHMRMAILLGVYAGQRVTDVRLARPEHFDVLVDDHFARPLWVWMITQNKRGRALQIPLHSDLVPALRLQRQLAAAGPGTLIWDEATGKPFTKERLFSAWEKVRAEAAKTLPDIMTLQERDLRRTFSTLSRAGGAGDSDVTDVLGNTAHKDAKLRRVYMSPQLVTAARAVAAIEKPKAPERKKA